MALILAVRPTGLFGARDSPPGAPGARGRRARSPSPPLFSPYP
jgi:hypothetical protein